MSNNPRSRESLLYSNSLSQTMKEAPKDTPSRNHELLIQAGFMRQEAAGIYTLLPWGVRVLEKIERIVRDGMDSLGGQEVALPALQPKAVWEQTGRWDTVDVLFKVKSRIGDKEYALAATSEEIATPVARDRIRSYRDLPFALYQIGRKYRDETRAKSGIIRGREFGMKDMYSFHATTEDFQNFYHQTLEEYLRIFRACGIDPKVTEASGGDFTTMPTHEIMALSEAGEDTIIYCGDCTFAQNTEISQLHAGDDCPRCQAGTLKTGTSIEIGHIFDLGTRFSKDFDLTFTDTDGTKKPVLMGCYGIGTTRLLGSIVELNNDEKGIKWPAEVAPYSCHLVGLNLEDPEVNQAAYGIYNYLTQQGVSVLFDNREEARAGQKFADRDLIGIPTRLVVSKKTVAAGSIEVSNRADGVANSIPLQQFFNQIEQK